MKCTSCEKECSEGVDFPCPVCGNRIFRCDKCRGLSIEYKCDSCGYVGP
ncbi:MAG: zinc finger domain-containing protein [Candidatus Pacearchaeota archaeon]